MYSALQNTVKSKSNTDNDNNNISNNYNNGTNNTLLRSEEWCNKK